MLGLLLELPPEGTIAGGGPGGSLTVYIDGVRVGTMVACLTPPLVWCVILDDGCGESAASPPAISCGRPCCEGASPHWHGVCHEL